MLGKIIEKLNKWCIVLSNFYYLKIRKDFIPFLKRGIKKNFPFWYKGEMFWYSRSCAVSGFVFKKVLDKVFVLANQRGEGTPDFQGYWNVPCGYLDWDEFGQEAVSREVYEECGFNTNAAKWKFLFAETDPKANKQNITLRYYYIASETDDYDLNSRFGGEENEVTKVEWIDVDKIDSYNYKWAFGHDSLIKEYIKQLKNSKIL